jgi:hypothetical protein
LGWFARRDRPERWRPTAPEREYDLVILTDPNIQEAELRVPRRMMLADAGGVQPRMAMAGLAICAAFVGGGMWCLRYRGERIPKKTVSVVGLAAVLILFGLTLNSYVDAKAQPIRPPPPVTLFENVEVAVRVVEQGDEVQLVLPPELAARIDGRTP